MEGAFDVMFKLLKDKSVVVEQRILGRFVTLVVRRHALVGRRETTPWDTATGVKVAHTKELLEFENEMHRWLQTWRIRAAAPPPPSTASQLPAL